MEKRDGSNQMSGRFFVALTLLFMKRTKAEFWKPITKSQTSPYWGK